MGLLRNNTDDFLALITAAADDISYPPAWIEKDYWITEVLRSLAEPIEGFDVVFKGGTSLSKAWGLIQRMSQDIDILIVPNDNLSAGARDRALRRLTARVGSAIGIEPRLKASGTGVHRASTILYRPAFGDPAVPPEVLLEMGIRGGPDPNEIRVVRSFIAEYATNKAGTNSAEFTDLADLELRCLKPERTLTEKLEAVHSLAACVAEGKAVPIGTSMRHYYDIAMLLGNQGVREALQNRAIVEIANDVEYRSVKAGWACAPRPEDGFAASPAFSDLFLLRADVRNAYSQVLHLVVGGPRPTLDDVLATISASRELL